LRIMTPVALTRKIKRYRLLLDPEPDLDRHRNGK
jgi:hypothetical protein